MDMSKDLVAASATPLVLAILAEGDSYGYAIIKRVAELSGGHLQWTDGMLYPVLHRLERQGFVAAKWAASTSWPSGSSGRPWMAPFGEFGCRHAQYEHFRRSANRGSNRAVAGVLTPPAGRTQSRRGGARGTSARPIGGAH